MALETARWTAIGKDNYYCNLGQEIRAIFLRINMEISEAHKLNTFSIIVL